MIRNTVLLGKRGDIYSLLMINIIQRQAYDL